MTEGECENPLLTPIRDTWRIKRSKRTGMVPASWLLVLLCLLDRVRNSDVPLNEDDVYTYDYALKNSRGDAIPQLLERYGLPSRIGLGNEGVTTRGAPGLRFFRAIGGGAVIADRSRSEREALVDEAVELIRVEILQIVGQNPVSLPSHVFDQSGTMIAALLEEVSNRSHGRVEQALVGAKLALRFPDRELPILPGFAADRQTGRECDYEVDNLRVIVSVAPKDQHFESARLLAQENRQVYLVVSESSIKATKHRLERERLVGRVFPITVSDYVTNNMMELSTQLKITAHEMCMKLVAEYNRRVAADNDHSLQIVVPNRSGNS